MINSNENDDMAQVLSMLIEDFQMSIGLYKFTLGDLILKMFPRGPPVAMG